jgi:hypothetical protein
MLNKTRSTREQIEGIKREIRRGISDLSLTIYFLCIFNYWNLPNAATAHRIPKQWLTAAPSHSFPTALLPHDNSIFLVEYTN